MNNHSINLERLNEEMCYEPYWYIDKVILNKLFIALELKDQDYLEIARLYIKYTHIMHRPEIQKYFNYLISKTKYLNIYELCYQTRILYKKIK